VPGSAAFIIVIAGAKLRSALACADLMLVFAVWHRSAVDDAQIGQLIPWEKREPGCALVVAESPFFSFCSSTICGWFSLASYTHRATCAGAVQHCSAFVRIKRGFGYTQRVGDKPAK